MAEPVIWKRSQSKPSYSRWDAPPPMKVRRAHLASLNACRLFGGGFQY